MPDFLLSAMECMERCRILSLCTEEPGAITRRYLSPPMHAVHREVRAWMEKAGFRTWIDAAGNVRGTYGTPGLPALLIGSHLDTVPHGGAFDGILGVVMGIELVRLLEGLCLPFPIDLAGFSEEEGVRFGLPFIGSRALIGDLDEALLAREDAGGENVRDAIRFFGLNPARLPEAALTAPARGYLEFHIEQGPVLEHLNRPLGVVRAIAGQTRAEVRFTGRAGHAGATPMYLRKDALVGAAAFIAAVEQAAQREAELVATVGRIEAEPGVANVIAGSAVCSLDVRHPDDAIRRQAVAGISAAAQEIAAQRGLDVTIEIRLEQPSVNMDPELTGMLSQAAGNPPLMTSGAGHDAMIVARRMPCAMLFLRSPGGISHHPAESVIPEDVAAALEAGLRFLKALERAA